MNKKAEPGAFNERKIYAVKSKRNNYFKLQKIDGVFMFVNLDNSADFVAFTSSDVSTLFNNIIKGGVSIYEFNDIDEFAHWILNKKWK